MKDKFETFRASEKERQELKRMAKRAKMSKSDYIRHCIFRKEITVIDGLDEFSKQLKAIGNNLNQLTTRVNMGHFEAINLLETKEKLGEIYDLLASLCRQEPVVVAVAEEDIIPVSEPEIIGNQEIISERKSFPFGNRLHNLFKNYANSSNTDGR
ncbi:Bacterial mobilization protein (MobC) (modular protein) [uncultured Eubacteriales bacterium]|uniref:Bacterial mobilization protein (MobC) (Modular protein) n=1 Tax=uncultured Eubacteriales bacterium TaxID=172733 RepID=A0A212KEF5_9FIRM|nr:Bacterial mobilization protein (MobC) (modular protein) [uncultured Eubacteriales bacterium]